MTTSQQDRDRFTAVYTANVDRVLAYALRHVAPAEAEDLVAETFAAAWRHLDEVPDNPLPWLLVVARRKITDLYRRRGRQPEVLDAGPRLLRVAADHDTPEGTVVDRETLLAAVASLSTIEREALLLTAWDGLSAAQAAKVLGISRVTFSSRLHRARTRLSTSLDVNDRSTAVAAHPTLLEGHA